jgi:hypothetical protein
MKDYLAGIATLLIVIVLLGRVTLGQVARANKTRADLVAAASSLDTSRSNSAYKNRQLVSQFGNDDVTRFMLLNGATLQSMTEIGSINQRIGAESEALRIPIQEQKTDARTMPGRAGTVLATVQMHAYSIAILSTFRDSLTWLGKIEDAFPYARIESVVYSPSGDFVNLQVKILFPRMDPAVITK